MLTKSICLLYNIFETKKATPRKNSLTALQQIFSNKEWFVFMIKNGNNKNSVLKNIKKIPAFTAQVVKVGSKYIFRKTKESLANKQGGRTLKEMFVSLPGDAVRIFRSKSVAGKLVLCSCALLVVGLFCLHGYFVSHFPVNTYINGIEVSKMSLKEARNAITASADNYQLALIEKDGQTEMIKASDINMTINIDKSFDDILKLKSGYSRLFSLFSHKVPDHGESITYSYDKNLLNKRISELKCINVTSPKQPLDAKLVYHDGEFLIEPSSSGDEVNLALLKSKVENAIETQQMFLDLETEGVYVQPKITSDDPQLVSKKNTFDTLIGIDIKLKIGEFTEEISPETLASWYSDDLRFDDSRIDSFVADLADKYDNLDSPKLFVTHYNETIELGNSYYGWQLNQEYAKETLRALIKEKKTVSLDLTDTSEESDKWWNSVGVAYGDLDYYGNTYAEVSIDEQYMWMYMDGQIVFESEVVTGLPDTEHDTPVGIYKIIYKEENATLRGDDYETVVAYWMVFTYDIGFHDADWQDAFGEGIYEYSGSHGCVNLPTEAAAELYDLVYNGMPVFVY